MISLPDIILLSSGFIALLILIIELAFGKRESELGEIIFIRKETRDITPCIYVKLTNDIAQVYCKPRQKWPREVGDIVRLTYKKGGISGVPGTYKLKEP